MTKIELFSRKLGFVTNAERVNRKRRKRQKFRPETKIGAVVLVNQSDVEVEQILAASIIKSGLV